VVPDTTEFRPFSNSDSNFAVRSPRISVIQGQGVLLEFHLPDPSAQMGVAGEVHLQWTPSPLHRGGIVLGRVSPAGPSGSQMRRPAADNNGRVSFHPSDEEEKPESRVSALLSKLPAADFQALKARLPAMSRTAATPAKLAIGPVLTLASLPARPGTARLLVPQSVPNARLAQRNELLRSTLCQQYKNNVPGYPGACQPMLNRTILRRMENRP
jgi:hypothetical protein